MRKRDVVVFGGVLAVVIATAVVVIIFSDCRHSPKSDSCPGDWPDPRLVVIVSTEDIPANQPLDPLIEEDLFQQRMISHDALVVGAVTDIRDLYGMTTTTPILAKEQISLEYLR